VRYSARRESEIPGFAPRTAEDRKRLQGSLLHPASVPQSPAQAKRQEAKRASAEGRGAASGAACGGRDAASASSKPATPLALAAAKQQRSRQLAEASRSDDERVARAARSILNKLTVEKFDLLLEQLASCGVRTADQLLLLMREIFEKAVEQHYFLPMYADLCVRLEADARLQSAVSSSAEPGSFRRLLLGECQGAFETLFEAPPQPLEVAVEDREEMAARRKRRVLGNVKLVGHLLVRGMLSSKLLVECADALLAARGSCPEALECLTALLKVAGPNFDRPEWPSAQRLQAVFASVEALTRDSSVPPRMRFLLRDVLDLRKAGWPAAMRPTAEPKGPMRLQDVKREAEKSLPEASHGPGRRYTAPTGGNTEPRSAKGANGSGNSGSRKSAGACPKQQEVETKAARTPKAAAAEAPVAAKLAKRTKEADGPSSAAKTKQGQQSSSGRGRTGGACGAAAEPSPGKRGAARSNAGEPAVKEGPGAARSSRPEQSRPVLLATQKAAAPAAPAAPAPGPAAAAAADAPVAPGAFGVKEFNRELAETLRELGTSRDVAAAVRRVRAQCVPASRQCDIFVDILTRAAEEPRGPARRASFAFAAGLAASGCVEAEDGAFDRSCCSKGAIMFFREVYQDLCQEVPRLQQIAALELLPALSAVAPRQELGAALPAELRLPAPSA